MGRVYLVSDDGAIARRRRELPGQLIEAWPDLYLGDLFWLGDDEARQAAYSAVHREPVAGALYWIGEASKAALDRAGPPLPWDLAIEETSVPIYYGPGLTDRESLPAEDSVRARVLSAHGIAAIWMTYDASGARVEHQPTSPLDPVFHLRRPGGRTVHLFRTLTTRTEAVSILACDWAAKLPVEDFADLIQRHATRPSPFSAGDGSPEG
jgi:hypothetical protein